LLDEAPDPDRIAARGQALFAIAAILLGASDPRLDDAGRLFAFADHARRGGPTILGQVPPSLIGHRFDRRLRPLTAFSRLAARDVRRGPPLEPEATPARAAALLAHRLTGVIA